MKQYNQNIEKLLDLGKELIGKVDYRELGLNSNDGDNLLRMVIDDKFHFSMQSKNHPYAPIHAIYALGNLKIQECFDEVSKINTRYKDDKYIEDAIKSYAISLNTEVEVVEEKIIEEVVEELIIVEDEPKKEVKKEEEIIVIESDMLIKEAIDEMQQDKPRPKKQRAPVKQPEKIIKVGRNDPCPCGSGKKYKKCCINL